MKTPLAILLFVAVLAGAMIFGHGARSQVATATPAPAFKAGDALIKMVLSDGSQRVRNQIIPITPNAAIGWDAGGNPVPLPMPTPFSIPIGTPTATTPGTDGMMMMDNLYVYTFLSGSWSKSARLNLTPQ